MRIFRMTFQGRNTVLFDPLTEDRLKLKAGFDFTITDTLLNNTKMSRDDFVKFLVRENLNNFRKLVGILYDELVATETKDSHD